MNRTKIEYCDFTWNPIKGLCPEACWYCYARRMYQRFGMRGDPHLDGVELGAPLRLRSDTQRRRVFVCSTFEIFSPVADPWRDHIFSIIQRCRDLTFIILTKRPERIDRSMPDNVWLGVSVTGDEDWYRVRQLSAAKVRVKFVSIEPFLGRTPDLRLASWLNWVIVGRLTGHGTKNDPELSAIGWIIAQATEHEIPLFMKNNLNDICRGELIQEYPK